MWVPWGGSSPRPRATPHDLPYSGPPHGRPPLPGAPRAGGCASATSPPGGGPEPAPCRSRSPAGPRRSHCPWARRLLSPAPRVRRAPAGRRRGRDFVLRAPHRALSRPQARGCWLVSCGPFHKAGTRTRLRTRGSRRGDGARAARLVSPAIPDCASLGTSRAGWGAGAEHGGGSHPGPTESS